MNDFFSSIVTSLNLPEPQNADPLSDNIDHPFLKAIMKSRNHPSALAIAAVHENRERFTFSSVTLTDVAKEINILNSSKAIQETNLPIKLLKDNKDFFAAYIAKYFKDSLKSAKFPNCLKLASITPVFKKNARTSKTNYGPGSVLPVISKIFEHLICNQHSGFFEEIFSKFQCGFRKGYSTEHCLLLMLESWKEAVDKNKTFGALMTDLSKAFDCHCHDLLIAKLHAYRIDLSSLMLLQDFYQIVGKEQKLILNLAHGRRLSLEYHRALVLVPQRQYTRCDLSFRKIGEKLLLWFSDNKIKLKTDKCHFLLNTQDLNFLKIGNFNIENSFSEKLLNSATTLKIFAKKQQES